MQQNTVDSIKQMRNQDRNSFLFIFIFLKLVLHSKNLICVKANLDKGVYYIFLRRCDVIF